MAAQRITTPVEGFTGVVAGVSFANGEGETDNEVALAYFRRHGYGIEAVGKHAAPAEPEPPKEPQPPAEPPANPEGDGKDDGSKPPAPAKAAAKPAAK